MPERSGTCGEPRGPGPSRREAAHALARFQQWLPKGICQARPAVRNPHPARSGRGELIERSADHFPRTATLFGAALLRHIAEALAPNLAILLIQLRLEHLYLLAHLRPAPHAA